MVNVGRLLRFKKGDVWWVPPGEPVFEALKLMADKNVGALPVIEEGKLAGIFSERDYARNTILRGKSCLASTVGQLMTVDVYCVSAQDTIEDCMGLMTAKHIRHLPVLEDERVVGILTLGDVVKEIISDQEYTIRELEKFISRSSKGKKAHERGRGQAGE